MDSATIARRVGLMTAWGAALFLMIQLAMDPPHMEWVQLRHFALAVSCAIAFAGMTLAYLALMWREPRASLFEILSALLIGLMVFSFILNMLIYDGPPEARLNEPPEAAGSAASQDGR